MDANRKGEPVSDARMSALWGTHGPGKRRRG